MHQLGIGFGKINSMQLDNINISRLLKNECDFFLEVNKCLNNMHGR